MRWAELGLALTPVVLFIAWWIAARMARPIVLWAAVAVVVAFAVSTVWLGLARRLDRGETYVPAQVVGGQIVPGHGVPDRAP